MKKEDIQKLEDLGYVADSTAYRQSLIEVLNKNEENLKIIQEELKKRKKTAKKLGLFTKEELFKKNWTLEYAVNLYQENQKIILFEKLNKKLENKKPNKKIKI